MHRALAVAHVVIAILLIPVTIFASPLTPLLLSGPAWALWLGRRLWRRDPSVVQAVRRTHYVLLILEGLLIWWGVAALRAAEESAERGGGLLGGFGLIPITIGVTLAMFSVLTLLWTIRR